MRYKKSLTRDIIIFLIILLPTIILIFTLSPFEWDETISATAAKRTVPMAMCMTDENDRFCVVGYTENDDGSEKGFIAIYDIWGDLSLKKYWISDYNLHFNAVTHWGDTFIITGYKYSSPTNKDIVFVRISTTGEKQWEVTWDNSTNDVGVDIAKSESSIWVLGNYLNSSGAVKSVLLDLSANSKIKRTCYPFLNSSEIESLNCTSLDFVSSVENFVIAGSAKIESLDRTIVFTCKETDMSIQWYKTSTSSVATVAKDVDYDDNIYVTGYSSSNGLLIERYDELGTLVLA